MQCTAQCEGQIKEGVPRQMQFWEQQWANKNATITLAISENVKKM